MKKLVIHPKDRSTTFLKKVYENLDDVTLVQGGVGTFELSDLMETHDQIMMMGHGSPYGLLSMGQFDAYGYIVGDSLADQLAERDNNIFIWCNADEYVNYHKLKGFYTGMFISEPEEAYWMGLGNTPQAEVDESNTWFVESVNRSANSTPEDLHAYVKHDYGELIHANPVAKYNHERLYHA